MRFFVLVLLSLLVYDLSAQENYLPCSDNTLIIKHKYYTLSYSEKDEQPEWLIYCLTREHLLNSTAYRSDNFRPDPAVSTGSAVPSDYVKSGYDKGHLAPAADMGFCQEAMSESFLMSNMTPQAPSFNRGIWKRLEDQVRDWGLEYDSLYVITAGILTGSDRKTGHNDVTVPDNFYKIVLRVKNNDLHVICFIIPNSGSKEELSHFVMSVDALESMTGIDFFCHLKEEVQEHLESAVHPEEWDLK